MSYLLLILQDRCLLCSILGPELLPDGGVPDGYHDGLLKVVRGDSCDVDATAWWHNNNISIIIFLPLSDVTWSQ